MDVKIFDSRLELAQAAANEAASLVRQAIALRSQAYLIAATGTSQFEFLDALVLQPGIDWGQVTFFHLDEYVGLPKTHPASFRRYLQERIVDRIQPRTFHFLNGDAPDPAAECRRVGELISRQTIDAAFVGIGENGHLAFNDPPADFETEEPYLIVDLDEACRRQQVGEGWFESIEAVPTQAISMSIRQILKASNVLCVVPDQRKAKAVRDCLELAVSPLHPASILQQDARATIYLDTESAALLKASTATSQLSDLA
ncbi:MAG TPA: glucosamine-6-phosphate deaminase [Pyrinomonadaceae bacterium]|nr:glucosamine-6-phosphate deaminase [Pyrinomonadaceae bacterium]